MTSYSFSNYGIELVSDRGLEICHFVPIAPLIIILRLVSVETVELDLSLQASNFQLIPHSIVVAIL